MTKCPLCEGHGEITDSAVELLLRDAAKRLGFRLTKIPEARKPATDWAPVIAALSTARESLGFGPAIYTGSSKQLAWLSVGTVTEWLIAIDSQRNSLARARLTSEQKNAYLSLQTIARNWERCLEQASQAKPRYEQLDDGRWVEVSPSGRRILSEHEIRSLNLGKT